MAQTDLFRRQHQELLQIVEEISPLLNAGALDKEAVKVRALLATLAGKLKVHLSAEDNALYPKLLNHKDPEVATLARQYQEEMGGLKQAFGEYLSRWPGPAQLQRDLGKFIAETRDIFDALRRRIDKENHGLYAVVDRID
ncbi:MAG TPA: hemerythrin domain-containing protein [Firmicutes bacterium]|nr:hemerythrin domain-containing protein [Bacillota bacterium]